MNTFPIRILSALIAATVFILIFHFYGSQGLRVVCFLAPLLGTRELIRILFKPTDSPKTKVCFFLLSLAIFWVTVLLPSQSTLGFVLFSILFCCTTIVLERKSDDLSALFLLQAKGILGFFYGGLLPGMTTRLLDLPNGHIWFLTMLSVVFAGDSLAYICGILWGKKKILPSISPKKTLVGSLGGLLGSGIAGAFAGIFFLSHISLGPLILVSLATGIVAQLGDLFESLLKRIANRKDSGSIMPGHGGILDRLDGVLFGAPMMLAGALLLEKLL